MNDDQRTKKKDTYIKITLDYKTKIAKYILGNGNCAAARKYSSELNENLNKSTVRSWVVKYKKSGLRIGCEVNLTLRSQLFHQQNEVVLC